MSSRAKAAIVAALCALARAGAPAQELPAALPVDVHQVRAIALNPALAAFSGEYLELGVRESYLGISASNLALTAGFMTYAFADPVRGWTLRASHFSASSLRRSRIGAGYGRAPTSWLALGLSADAINLGYHHLDLVDPGDPLFAGGTSRVGYGIGAGLLLRSAAGVELGASVQDLNRPDLSLDPRADARLPARLHGALRLPIGDLILAAGLRDIELGSPAPAASTGPPCSSIWRAGSGPGPVCAPLAATAAPASRGGWCCPSAWSCATRSRSLSTTWRDSATAPTRSPWSGSRKARWGCRGGVHRRPRRASAPCPAPPRATPTRASSFWSRRPIRP